MAYNKRNYRNSSSQNQDQEAKATWQQVTDRFIAALEKGRIPWRKPWRTEGYMRPFNPITGTKYQGVNVLTLGLEDFTDPRFMTFKQISDQGGKVVKGSKGQIVVFYKDIVVNKTFQDETGNEEELSRLVRMAKHFMVFNYEQTEGLNLPDVERVNRPEHEVNQVAEGLFKAYSANGGPTLAHGGSKAFYSPSRDHIQMPMMGLFVEGPEYYGTLFHEAIHSTGHASRLNRPELVGNHSFGSDNYSREELVAEIGSAYILSDLGLDSPSLQENQEAYIQSWIKSFKNDPRMILWAGAKASAGAGLVMSGGN